MQHKHSPVPHLHSERTPKPAPGHRKPQRPLLRRPGSVPFYAALGGSGGPDGGRRRTLGDAKRTEFRLPTQVGPYFCAFGRGSWQGNGQTSVGGRGAGGRSVLFPKVSSSVIVIEGSAPNTRRASARAARISKRHSRRTTAHIADPAQTRQVPSGRLPGDCGLDYISWMYSRPQLWGGVTPALSAELRLQRAGARIEWPRD
jgi:hypothetical protein